MDLLFWGMTLSIAGEILIGIAVFNVHRHISKEHRIDGDVLSAIRREKKIVLAAIALLIIGYLAQIYANGYFIFFIGT